MASSIEDMAYALDTTHDPDKFAEHIHPCPEGQDCNCGLGLLLADGLRVLEALGAERMPR